MRFLYSTSCIVQRPKVKTGKWFQEDEMSDFMSKNKDNISSLSTKMEQEVIRIKNDRMLQYKISGFSENS